MYTRALLPPPTSYVSGHREGSRWLSLPLSLHTQLVGTLSSQNQVPRSLGAAPRNAQDIHPSIHPSPPPLDPLPRPPRSSKSLPPNTIHLSKQRCGASSPWEHG